MGGNAFGTILPAIAFPRMPPPIYRALKRDMLAKISGLYDRVSVPREAPEKVDYGDLDFVVTDPKPVYGSSVPHEVIKQAIGAKYVNAMEGNRTSNYAVPDRTWSVDNLITWRRRTGESLGNRGRPDILSGIAFREFFVK